jgi:hypothetical protein
MFAFSDITHDHAFIELAQRKPRIIATELAIEWRVHR